MRSVNFTLPFPPTINQYYRAIAFGGKARTIKSKAAREYPAKVKAAIGFWPDPPLTGDLKVYVNLYCKTAHRRDIDNYTKGLFDALTVCRIWADDSQVVKQIVELHRSDQEIPEGLKGKVTISIWAADDKPGW